MNTNKNITDPKVRKTSNIWNLEQASVWQILGFMAVLGTLFVAAFCLKSVIIDNEQIKHQASYAARNQAKPAHVDTVQQMLVTTTIDSTTHDTLKHTTAYVSTPQNTAPVTTQIIYNPEKRTTLETIFLYITALGTGLLVAGACYCMGGFLGFLFGIPRYMQHNEAATSSSKRVISQNDNLVQISDWLTKVIVGVGLTQIYKIPHVIKLIGTELAPSFSGTKYFQDAARNAAIVTILYFTVLGFLTVYLWTQLFFTKMLEEAADADDEDDSDKGTNTQVQTVNIKMPDSGDNK